MTAKTAELFADQSRRVQIVIGWHTAVPGRRKGSRHLTLCTECGQPYPCRTRLELLGHTTTGAGAR